MQMENEEAWLSKSCLHRIRSAQRDFSPIEQKIAGYILANPFDTIRSSTENIANRCAVSQASIIRFCQKLGYKGFREMKIVLAQEVGSIVPKILADEKNASGIDYVTELLKSSIDGMQRTVVTLDRAVLNAAIDAIAAARLVDIYGAGESFVIGEDLHLKLKRIGIPGTVYPNPHLQAISAAALKPGDVAIGISFSGSTRDTIDSIKVAKQTGATTIAITNFPDFPLGETADIVLVTNATEALFPYGTMSSRIAQLFVVDLLFAGLLIKHGHKFKRAYEYYNKIIQGRL